MTPQYLFRPSYWRNAFDKDRTWDNKHYIPAFNTRKMSQTSLQSFAPPSPNQ